MNQDLSFIYWLAFGASLSAWVYADMRSRGIPIYLDQGLLVYIAWPISFPHYLFISRGARRGCLALLFLVGLYFLSLITAIGLGVFIEIGENIFK